MSSVIKSSLVIENNIAYPQFRNKTECQKEDKVKESIKEVEIIKENILMAAKEESEKIIVKAREMADKYLEETYVKAKQIIEESRQTGYEEGYYKGFNEGKKLADQLIREANEIKKEYLHKRRELVKEVETDIINLVIKICENILNIKIDEDKETIISIINKGLNNLNVSDSLIIKVSKDDYDIVELSKERIVSMASFADEIDIKIDNNLKKGGCIIETAKGSIDVSLSSQIENLKSIILSLLNSE